MEKITVNGIGRDVIRQYPILRWNSHIADSYRIYDNVSIQPNSKLKFGIAMHQDSCVKDTDGVTYKILVEDEQGVQEVFSAYINPKENTEDRKWKDHMVNLSGYAGKIIKIYFATNPKNHNAYDWSYRSEPLLLKSRG